jgi:sugar lactone lactonase YvrE
MPKGNMPLIWLFYAAGIVVAGFLFPGCQKKGQPIPAPPANTSAIWVTTFAGDGSTGFTDGAGIQASFYQPASLTTDASGNIYVSDTGNGLIRRVTSAGDVSTIAGTAGVHSSILGYPFGIARDMAGNIYVGDVENEQILKIAPGGFISVLAGSGNIGFKDGPGYAASFNGPFGIAIDGQGNIYVADAGNNAIRKVTPAGYVITIAGNGTPGMKNGPGAQAEFLSPYGIAVDASGGIFVADTFNQLIRKVGSDGTVSTVAGGGIPGSDKPGYFASPYGIAVDTAGNLYVADFDANQVRIVDAGGAVKLLAGSGQPGANNGQNTTAAFNGPSGVALDGKGNLLVADYRNNKIREISLANQ